MHLLDVAKEVLEKLLILIPTVFLVVHSIVIGINAIRDEINKRNGRGSGTTGITE